LLELKPGYPIVCPTFPQGVFPPGYANLFLEQHGILRQVLDAYDGQSGSPTEKSGENSNIMRFPSPASKACLACKSVHQPGRAQYPIHSSHEQGGEGGKEIDNDVFLLMLL
jgi:hypothetical protein